MNAYSSCKALIIGVGRYADPQYDLSYARSDAEAMAEMLGNEFGFDQVWTLYDNDATRQNLIRFFEQDLQRTEEDDGLLIFFAGHGITVTSAIGDDRGFLVPHDGDPKQPYANLSLTTIRDDYMPMIPAKHVFLIVDSCYGGLALRDVATVERPKSIDDAVLAELTRRDRKVRQVLAAGTKDQRVLDGGLFGHSVFTGRLIEALREANPYITADHVGVHVRERVARDSLDRKHRQTPQFGYLFGGDGTFLFVKSPFRRVTSSSSSCALDDLRDLVRSWLASHPKHSESEWRAFLRDHINHREDKAESACDAWRQEFLAQRRCVGVIVSALQQPGQSLVSTITTTAGRRQRPSRMHKPDVAEAPVHTGSRLEHDSSPKPGKYTKALQSYRLTSQEAIDVIDEWSSKTPAFLSPLSAYATVQSVTNRCVVRVELETLCETRERGHVHKPAATTIETKQQQIGLWDIPLPVPSGFRSEKSTWESPYPAELTGCPKCGGTGILVCSSCNGQGMTKCKKCDGKGTTFKLDGDDLEKTQCGVCGGSGRRSCTSCGGRGRMPCAECAAVGRVYRFPTITATFTANQRVEHFADRRVDDQVTSFGDHGIGSFEGPDLTRLEFPSDLPVGEREAISRFCHGAVSQLTGKLHRCRVRLAVVPYTEVEFIYRTTRFTIVIEGTRKDVHATWRPRNVRRLVGSVIAVAGLVQCLVCGILALVLTNNARTETHWFSPDEHFPATWTPDQGILFAGISGTVVLLGLAVFLWSRLSKPKPNKGGPPNAV